MEGNVRILIVTEKANPPASLRDGGNRLVRTLRQHLEADILQFGPGGLEYPHHRDCRFERRLANASFVRAEVERRSVNYDIIVFVHVSMAFGYQSSSDIYAVVFPMFLTPSYIASGEEVPANYANAEKQALAAANLIITPSFLECRQLEATYAIPRARIRVLPRGINVPELQTRKMPIPHRPVRCVSVGSIKPQKGTLRLIELFARIRERCDAHLSLIGPVQDQRYARTVRAKIRAMGLQRDVTFLGHVSPDHLGTELAGTTLHLSATWCETFGRAIFETLASGIPNVTFREGNAAAEYLADQDGIRFVASNDEFVDAALDTIRMPERQYFPTIRDVFDDAYLGKLLAAEVMGQCSPIAVVSDFDGTLLHKCDSERTLRSVETFNRFGLRVICSARPIDDLADAVKTLGLHADYLIGLSGAELADGSGRLIKENGLPPEICARLSERFPLGRWVQPRSLPLQMRIDWPPELPEPGTRAENYGSDWFISHRSTNKLSATVQLLRSEVGWAGRVRAFGDGPSDTDFLTFFDGTLVGSKVVHPHLRTATEISHD
jgi:glycosyltransferase involved in cell wall biosynthesis